ncbi:GNAT family N-acetyltransferase [Saprospiraceae bacterium]|nr:GNAT family N-acetyltransferase [Saprospiraceae bacterium]
MTPISEKEKEYFFEQATGSDATPLWYGARYGDDIPDKNKFFEDWQQFYFQDRENERGRCFHILREQSKIGQVNYNSINNDEVDVDILIYSKENWSKGYGTSAIKLMCAYLEEKYHVKKVWIDVHTENNRAMKAYEKAGFSSEGKQGDLVRLTKFTS